MTKMNKIAKQIKTFFSPAGAEQRLWLLDPPINNNHFIITSAAITPSGPETLIFLADKNGKIADWGELGGSVRGNLDHANCICNLGYSVTSD